jgi:hypothetical protein
MAIPYLVGGGIALLSARAASSVAVYALLPDALKNDNGIQLLGKDKLPAEEFYSRKTFVTDVCVLKQAVESLGGIALSESVFRLRGLKILLQSDGTEGNQTLWFCGIAGKKAVKELAGEAEAEYVRLVREQLLQKLHNECDECGMHLESEEIEQDQTVVLTFRV